MKKEETKTVIMALKVTTTLMIEFAGDILRSATSDIGSLHKIEASLNAHKGLLPI